MPKRQAARPKPGLAGDHVVPTTDAVVREQISRESFLEHHQAGADVFWCIAAGVLGGRTHVEDVLQEAAMIALSKLDQFDPGTNFIAWMGQIVRFVALNQGRRMSRSKTQAIDLDLIEPVECWKVRAGPSPVNSRGDLSPEQTAFDDEVLHALQALDETARACLLLRIVLNKPYREIALILDIPEGTAMSHVHRGRHALRKQLREGDPPSIQMGDGA
jgi:RNA polymerase sigma-70 factor (ECF subfamily)